MKKVFSWNPDGNKNAILNWRTKQHEQIRNMNVLAKGYFENAIMIIKDCLHDNRDHRADSLIFPILFTANHAIELYLKSICWSINILLEKKEKFKTNHNIFEIWEKDKNLITDFGFNEERPKESFNKNTYVLKEYLGEISKKLYRNTNNSKKDDLYFSRYPLDKRFENYFYIDSFENEAIDLENLLKIYVNIEHGISLLADYYCDLVDKKLTAEAFDKT